MTTTTRLTNATGAPVADNTNIMTAGPRGPALLQDIWLLEKLAHFDREVIPERRMHAKGWGAAFSPANIVSGIGFSPDKVLQGRLFSYGDTQRYRLGVNFNHIPVNAPKCPFQSYHRDGKMRTDGNLGRTTTFNPNSAGLWDNQPDFAEPPMPIEGEAAHCDQRLVEDHWEQPGNLFRTMTKAQQQVLFENTARAMGDARAHIKQRYVDNCTRADPPTARAWRMRLPS
jgi:catalase